MPGEWRSGVSVPDTVWKRCRQQSPRQRSPARNFSWLLAAAGAVGSCTASIRSLKKSLHRPSAQRNMNCEYTQHYL